MSDRLTPFDGPVSESLSSIAAAGREETPLVVETLRQERLLGQLTESFYVLRDKLSPFLGSYPEDTSEKSAKDSGSSEFIRVLSDNNDRLEIVINNINATRSALEI